MQRKYAEGRLVNVEALPRFAVSIFLARLPTTQGRVAKSKVRRDANLPSNFRTNTNDISVVTKGPGGAGCRPRAPVAEGGPIGFGPMGGTTGGFPTGPGGRGGAGARTRTLSL